MEKQKYPKGKNPNSLANLKKGQTFKDRKIAKEASMKAEKARKAKRTMREMADEIGQEEQTIQIKRNDGTEETVTMSRLEIIMRNFMKECAKNPSHKNVLALAKIRGEEENQHITIEGSINTKYNDIEITPEMEAKALALLKARHDANK